MSIGQNFVRKFVLNFSHKTPLPGWPENGDMLMFDQLTTPVLEAIRAAYNLERTPLQSIPWSGPETGFGATTFSAKETLADTGLEYAQERGRDALEVIVSVAIRLGAEQGVRMYKQDSEFLAIRSEVRMLQLKLREAEAKVAELKDT